MPPEYRIFIPQSAVAEFESKIGELTGSEILSKRKKRHEERSDPMPPINYDELASKLKVVLSLYPDTTTIDSLESYRFPGFEEDRNPPEGWLEFARTLNQHERSSLTAALKEARQGLREDEADLGKLRNNDWSRVSTYKRSTQLLKAIFD